MNLEEQYVEYVELFNERNFYDCHEVLEELWLDYEGPARKYYQGLIHLASAYLLLMRGNMRGCRARFASTLGYFSEYPTTYMGLDLEPLRVNVALWLDRLDGSDPGARLRYVDSDVPMLKLDLPASVAEGDY